jgi:single-stranded-DNA-specific exonuclease
LNEALEKIKNPAAEEILKSEMLKNISDADPLIKDVSLVSVAEIHVDPETDFIDAQLTIDDVNYRLHDDLNKLAPFGVGNPKPFFLFKNVAPDTVRRFGKTSDHVELVFKKANGVKVPAIAFFGATEKWAESLQANQSIDLIASVEKSMFRGRPELRLRVIDVVVK